MFTSSHLTWILFVSACNPKADSEYPDYLVKWESLPYSDATWEDGSLIVKKYDDKIREFREREDSKRTPSKLCRALKIRPKFQPLKEQPEFIGRDSVGFKLNFVLWSRVLPKDNFGKFLVVRSPRLPVGWSKLVDPRLVQRKFRHFSRWNGFGQDHSDHQLPQLLISCTAALWAILGSCSLINHGRLAERVWSVGSEHQRSHVHRGYDFQRYAPPIWMVSSGQQTIEV